MKKGIKGRVSKNVYPNGPDEFHFYILESHRFRFLNHRAVNILSMFLVSLFDDFYPTMKH